MTAAIVRRRIPYDCAPGRENGLFLTGRKPSSAMPVPIARGATLTVATHLQHRLHAASIGEAAFSKQETAMFKMIGGVVVYGFALLGLATYLEKLHSPLMDD